MITLNIGDRIPELEEGKYLVRLCGTSQIVISPLSLDIMKRKLNDFKYKPIGSNGFHRIYDSENGALEVISIEEIK